VEYLEGNNYNLAFRRNLHGDNLSNWNSMVQDICEIPRNEESDVVYWAFNKNGKFSTKSMYVFPGEDYIRCKL
jgi:hypothetical protein